MSEPTKPHFQEKAMARLYPRPTVLVIFGLPGSGKTKLARDVAACLNCMHINADAVRSSLNSDLGFSPEDRLKNAFRLGAVAGLSVTYSPMTTVVVDFVNPTKATHDEFLKGLRSVDERLLDEAHAKVRFVMIDTLDPSESRFEDTAALFDRSRAALGMPTMYQPHLVIWKGSSEERLSRVMNKFFSS